MQDELEEEEIRVVVGDGSNWEMKICEREREEYFRGGNLRKEWLEMKVFRMSVRMGREE